MLLGTIALLSAGVRSVGNGGGFIEIMILDELKSLPKNLELLDSIKDLSSEEHQLISKLAVTATNIQIHFLESSQFPPSSYKRITDDGILACDMNQLYINHSQLLLHNGNLSNWHQIARKYLIEGLFCIENLKSNFIEKLTTIMIDNDFISTQTWGFKDIYKPDLGVLISIYKGNINKLYLIDSAKSINATEELMRQTECGHSELMGEVKFILKDSSLFIFDGDLNALFTFGIQGICHNQPVAKNLKLRLIIDTGSIPPQKVIDNPSPNQIIKFKNFEIIDSP